MFRISLAAKLYLTVIPLMAMGIVVGLVAREGLQTNATELIKARMVKELTVTSLSLVLTQDDATKSMLLDLEKLPEASAQKIHAYDSNVATLQKLKELTKSPKVLDLIERLRDMEEKELRPIDTMILETLAEGNVEAAQKRYFNRYQPVRAKYEALVRELGEVAEAAAKSASEKMEKNNERSIFNTFLSLIVGLILVGAIIFGVTGQITARLAQTVEVVEDVAAGNLTKSFEADSKDELGKMAQALNHMIERIHSAIQTIGHNSQALAQSSEELAATSRQMAGSAEETSTQANVVSASSEKVSNNVQSAATGAEEVGVSIREIAKNATEAAKIATHAVQVAEGANITVAKLGESSAEIGQIIKVITSIAEQTNLLALNATIEAARAGEAGKGFAVVASEVKELAKQTSRATDDISQKIRSIQGETQGAVQAIGQISEIIGQINDISNTIAGAVEEQSATTNEITRNVTEAAKGSSEITQNMAGMASAAEETTSGAWNGQSAAEGLARMAAELQNLVSQFQYHEKEGVTVQSGETGRPLASIQHVHGDRPNGLSA